MSEYDIIIIEVQEGGSLRRMNEQKALPGTIRERIQELMNRKRIKQAELAEKIGESSSTFSRFDGVKIKRNFASFLLRLLLFCS